MSSPFKDKKFNFFPVPLIETRPDEGQSYGLMPIALFSDKESEAITTILAAIGQYNSIVKWSGGAIGYWYPHTGKSDDEVVELYFEVGQRYYRETSVRYFNPYLFNKFYVDAIFQWLKTPFPRFFGLGAATVESDESNYVARNFLTKATFGYRVRKDLRINFGERFSTTDVLTRAFSAVADTLTRYGNVTNVFDSTHFIHTLSLTYDTRQKGENSTRGRMIEGGYFFSLSEIGSDTTFQGFYTEAIQLIPWWQGRTTTALRFFLQDMNGTNIPFYLMSQLGGDAELRAFIPNRFTDSGKIIFTAEQRIRVFVWKVLGIPVEFHADPFIEVGRVFNHFNHLNFDDIQPVGGLGMRAVVPPNVVGRVDIAVGTEGYSVYTMLGYPF